MTIRPEMAATTTLATSSDGGGGDRADWKREALISGGVIAVLVLGFLCLVLGAVYAYIYFTRINPRAANRAVLHGGRKYVEQAPPVDDSAQGTSTHLFLFKKS